MADIFLNFPANEVYVYFNQARVEPSIYGIGSSRMGKFFIEGEEGLDDEMLKLIEKSGSFDFLSNSEEDIYTFDDGETIC